MAETYLILRNGTKGKAPYIRCKGIVAARARAAKMVLEDIPTPDAAVKIYTDGPFPVLVGEVAYAGADYEFYWFPAANPKHGSMIRRDGRIKGSW